MKSKKSSKKAKPLTAQQQKFLTEYVSNGGNGTKAAKKAYNAKDDNSAAVIAHKTLEKPHIAEALREELAKQGVDLEAVVAPVTKALHATKKDGSDDHMVQLAGHDRAMKILVAEEKEQKVQGTINFNINKANFGGEFVSNE